MTVALWITAVLMMLVGVLGTVLPALPGVVFVFGGIVLAAWIDDFVQIGGWTLALLGVLTLVGLTVDLVTSMLFARRAGASRYGVAGAALGTIAGIFTGLLGLVFLPLAGAFAGEFLARRDALHAGRIGVATWIGLLVGAVLKLAVVFSMLGIFALALLL